MNNIYSIKEIPELPIEPPYQPEPRVYKCTTCGFEEYKRELLHDCEGCDCAVCMHCFKADDGYCRDCVRDIENEVIKILRRSGIFNSLMTLVKRGDLQ